MESSHWLFDCGLKRLDAERERERDTDPYVSDGCCQYFSELCGRLLNFRSLFPCWSLPLVPRLIHFEPTPSPAFVLSVAQQQPHPWWKTSATAQDATSNAAVLPLFGMTSKCHTRCWYYRGDSQSHPKDSHMPFYWCVC